MTDLQFAIISYNWLTALAWNAYRRQGDRMLAAFPPTVTAARRGT
jgi:hypothetical protein